MSATATVHHKVHITNQQRFVYPISATTIRLSDFCFISEDQNRHSKFQSMSFEVPALCKNIYYNHYHRLFWKLNFPHNSIHSPLPFQTKRIQVLLHTLSQIFLPLPLPLIPTTTTIHLYHFTNMIEKEELTPSSHTLHGYFPVFSTWPLQTWDLITSRLLSSEHSTSMPYFYFLIFSSSNSSVSAARKDEGSKQN